MWRHENTIIIQGGIGGAGGVGGQQGGNGGVGQGNNVHFSGPTNVHLPQGDDYHQIMDFVSPLNFYPRQQQINETRQKNTGNWLLEDSKFLEWKTGSTRLLWCSGIPGSGKTVLASLVVHELREAGNSDIGVACIYMDYKESSSQTEKHILGAIWRQLAGTQDLQAARPIREKHSRQQTVITLEETQDLLKISAASFYRVYVILDALDEYGSEDKDGLVDNILGIGKNIKLLVTTRTHLTSPQDIDAIDMEIHAAEDDIRAYVLAQLTTSRKLKRFAQDKELINKVLESMIGKAEGMFLAVKLQMDLLSLASTKAVLLKALEGSPANLNETYMRTLEHIKVESSPENIGLHALLWVAFTKRPLTLHELQAALAISKTNSHILDDSLVEQEIILEACRGLIILSGPADDQVFRLVHYSTQEFMDTVQAQKFPEAHINISRTLLICLQWANKSGDYSEPYYWWKNDMHSKSHPLLEYSQYILVHLKGPAEIALKTEVVETFQTIKRYPHWHIAPWNFEHLPAPLTVLWIAVAGNLLHLVTSLLNDLNQVGLSAKTIIVASRYGFQEMVKILQAGNIVMEDEDLSFALQQGAAGGHKEIVSYWLVRSAKVNDIVEGKTALHAAAREGHKEIVEILLQAGADTNQVAGYYGTALQAAAEGRELETLKLLLTAGADPNLVGGEYGTALQAAAYRGYNEICEALLQANADINLVAGDYGTALQAAAIYRELETLKLLLTAGADPNLVAGYYGTALQAAADWGYNEICEALLQANADINLVAGDQGTALQAAALGRELETLKLLLTAGADPNLVGGYYGTALQAAAYYGYNEICGFLLKANADVNLIGGKHGTALRAASLEGHQDIVQALIAAGADPDLATEYESDSNTSSSVYYSFDEEDL